MANNIIPVFQTVYPDVFSKLIVWNYYDQVGEGEAVEVYAWPRFTWQLTGDNVGDCVLEIYGTHEGPHGSCWGLLASVDMPIKDRMHDTFIIGHELPITRAVKPIIRGTPDPGNHLGVFLFCTKLFEPPHIEAQNYGK